MAVFFVDELERQLDERGRFILPAKIRETLSKTVYITPSVSDKCLHLYPEEEWEALAEKIRSLPTTTDKNAAAFVRLFFGRATSQEIDKQGRVSVSKRLLEYAGLTKDIVLIGANQRLEIWDKALWNSYKSELSEDVLLDGILKYDLNI